MKNLKLYSLLSLSILFLSAQTWAAKIYINTELKMPNTAVISKGQMQADDGGKSSMYFGDTIIEMVSHREKTGNVKIEAKIMEKDVHGDYSSVSKTSFSIRPNVPTIFSQSNGTHEPFKLKLTLINPPKATF